MEYATLDWYIDDAAGYYGETFRLTPEQMTELYDCCILPDIADGTIGLDWMTWGDEYYNTNTNVSINFSLRLGDPENPMLVARDDKYMTVTTKAVRTLAWIAENTDVECLPLRMASPPANTEILDKPA